MCRNLLDCYKWTELISILRNGSSGGGSGETVTLQSISATYTGGDVAVGTSLNDLTGITVTAHYSDGSTANVTGYTLSGTIAEGSNTITVSYGGKTTTFTVTGVAESSGNVTDITSFILQESYLKDTKAYLESLGTFHNKEYDYTSTIGGMYIANDDFSALDDYFNNGYDDLYAIAYFPNRSDAYNIFGTGSVSKQISYGVANSIGSVSVSSVRGETEDYKIYYIKVSKADILSAIEVSEYTKEDVNCIAFSTANVGSKNYGMRGVWMTTEPTEEQCIAIRDFFENGGEL